MTKEELDKEAEEFIDSKKSFWRQGWTCIESVKQAYIAGAEPREKRIADLEKENAELKEQIADLKNFCCEVSKYLHDNSVARPDASAYKKRDALLIKEFKLCEKWGDLK